MHVLMNTSRAKEPSRCVAATDPLRDMTAVSMTHILAFQVDPLRRPMGVVGSAWLPITMALGVIEVRAACVSATVCQWPTSLQKAHTTNAASTPQAKPH